MNIQKERVKKILVIKFRALGDILLSVPAMRALKLSYPLAKLYVLVDKGGEEILSGQDFIDEIMVFDKRQGAPVSRDLDLILAVMEQRFDLVVDMFGNLRSALLAFLSGAGYRVGLSNRVRKIFYNLVVEGPKEIIYNPEVWSRVASAAGAAADGGKPSILLGRAEEEYILGFLKESGLEFSKYVVLNPFASAHTREWPRQKFVELAGLLARSGIISIIAWGPRQEEAAGELKKAAGETALLAPKTGIKQLGWLLKKSAAVVTGTTFVQHLAVAVGANAVSIFGATDSRAWVDPAYGKQIVLQAKLDCMPCEKLDCSDFKCMNEISVLQVESAVKTFLS